MIISELNHIEVVDQENQVVGGSLNVHIDLATFWTKLDIKTTVDDNLAVGKADALAYGHNSYAKADTKTYTDSYASAASSKSVSATDDPYYYYY